MKKITIFILIFEIIFFLSSIFTNLLPGWKMFADFSQPEFRLQKQNRQILDAEKYLVFPNYSESSVDVIRLAEFICRKENTSIILDFVKGERYEAAVPHCQSQKR